MQIFYQNIPFQIKISTCWKLAYKHLITRMYNNKIHYQEECIMNQIYPIQTIKPRSNRKILIQISKRRQKSYFHVHCKWVVKEIIPTFLFFRPGRIRADNIVLNILVFLLEYFIKINHCQLREQIIIPNLKLFIKYAHSFCDFLAKCFFHGLSHRISTLI
jgi:hypothetical protein